MGAFDRLHGRDVVAGVLGCPVCKAEYPIRDGVAHFPAASPPSSPDDTPLPADDALVTAVSALADAVGVPPAMYLAALLDLEEPGGVVVLEGAWSRYGPALADMGDVRIVLLDPPALPAGEHGLSVIRATGTVPFAASSIRGAALAARGTAGAVRVPRLARVLAPRGRLVASAELPVPAVVTEIARDAACWVAERREAPSAPVRLTRGDRT